MGKASVAERQLALLNGHDYELTSDGVIFAVFCDRNGIAPADHDAAGTKFFAKG